MSASFKLKIICNISLPSTHFKNNKLARALKAYDFCGFQEQKPKKKKKKKNTVYDKTPQSVSQLNQQKFQTTLVSSPWRFWKRS